jgi:hypothetical protein
MAGFEWLVLNGCLYFNFGPPISLFHPVFDLIQIKMKTGGLLHQSLLLHAYANA